MSDQHPCAKLGTQWWQRRGAEGGKEKERASLKQKDRLGDNEWCKPDDLLVSAVRPHTLTWPLFFSFLSPHLSLSPSGPIDLLKLRKNSFLWAKNVLHLIMEETQRQWNNTVFICRVKCCLQQGKASSFIASVTYLFQSHSVTKLQSWTDSSTICV